MVVKYMFLLALMMIATILWYASYMVGRVEIILHFHTISLTNLPKNGVLIFLVLKWKTWNLEQICDLYSLMPYIN